MPTDLEQAELISIGPRLNTLIRAWRERNSDVFTSPTYLRSVLFTIEELNESVNAYENMVGSEHLRSTERQQHSAALRANATERAIIGDPLLLKLYIEMGQSLLMLISSANAMGVDNLGIALALALDKLDKRCEEKRNTT